MAEQKISPIGESDLIEYLDTQSDFALELRVFQALRSSGFTCEHGGTYDDPVTQKSREFDIRATKRIGHLRISLAVECKNIGDHFPLLISCLPRRPEEAFHQIIRSLVPSSPLQPRAEAKTRVGASSIYKPSVLVGKSIVQVGRKNNKVHASSNEIYDKWTQALSSAQDLIDRACYDGEEGRRESLTLVLPVLVIPDGTLWLAKFAEDGSRISKPQQAEYCSYFIGKSYFGGDNIHGFTYKISHLEFITLNYLPKIINNLLSQEEARLIFE